MPTPTVKRGRKPRDGVARVKINARIRASIAAELSRTAESTQSTVTEIIERALVQYLEMY